MIQLLINRNISICEQALEHLEEMKKCPGTHHYDVMNFLLSILELRYQINKHILKLFGINVPV